MTTRDAAGRYVGNDEINSAIRRAAGRGEGTIAGPPPSAGSQAMNDRLRAATGRAPAAPIVDDAERERQMSAWRQHARDLALVGREDEIPDPPFPPIDPPAPGNWDQGARPVDRDAADRIDMNQALRGDRNAMRRTRGVDY